MVLCAVRLHSLSSLSNCGKCMQAWQHICGASRKEFDAIYERLGVRLIWRGESYYNPKLKPLVQEMEDAGFSEESEGAKVGLCCGLLE